jgi:hypothetical protein
LLLVVMALQDLCLRGERLLALAEKLLDGDEAPGTSAEFTEVLGRQAREVSGLRSLLDDSKELMATLDAQLYLDLAPMFDRKSGLLTRWERQASLSEFSTTTLFFLPTSDLTRLLETGRAGIGPDGLDGERAAYVIAIADSIRDVRSREVRDIRLALEGVQDRVRTEIMSARTDLGRAKEYCVTLLGSTETAVGPEAMARLRRRLLP